jgi:CPA1 family monovalent cation:H+ antiporter
MLSSQILIVMVAAIGLTIFAQRRRIQPPLLLAAVGLAASFIPGLPRTDLDPQILLSVVVPPLLYSAAVDFSFSNFLRRLSSILNLGVVLVLVTALAVGGVVAILLPDLSLPAAMIVGAVVAPPDAVSAVAVGGRLGLPDRLMTVLKGESLINDAAALILFGLAVAAVTGRHTLIDNPWLYFIYASLAGILIGIVLALALNYIRQRLDDSTLISALALLTPFAAYALAEEVQASGIIAVVAAGFTLGHNAASLGYAGRIQEREVWRVVDALLEAFVFAYIGLQLRFVLEDAAHGGFSFSRLTETAAATIVVVIVVRFVWIMATALLGRWRYRRWVAAGSPKLEHGHALPRPLSWPENIVLGWAGMRGVVTLAAAAGAPIVVTGGEAFAAREAIIPIAFAVAIGTLLLQGLTLPWLIHLLDIEDGEAPAERHRQLRRARKIMRDASLSTVNRLRAKASPDEVAMVERFVARTRQSGNDEQQEDAVAERRRPQLKRALDAMRQVLAAQREALIAERDADRLDEDVMRELLEDIDIEEAVVANRRARLSDRGRGA